VAYNVKRCGEFWGFDGDEDSGRGLLCRIPSRTRADLVYTDKNGVLL